jgi:signal transduction histidine kinase
MTIIDQIDKWLALTAAIINGVFILLILTRTSRAAVYVTFLFNCLTSAIWTFGDFMVMQTLQTMQAKYQSPWFYFSLVGTGMIPAVMLHFISALAGLTHNRRWIATGYVLCLPLTLTAPLSIWYSGIRDFVKGDVWNALFLSLLFSSFTISILMLRNAIRGAKSESDKSRFRYVLVAVWIACFCGATDLLQDKNLPIPPLGHIGTVIYTSVLAAGVYKHRVAYDLLVEMRTKLDILNELAAGIAHELRNPLSSIKGALHLLNEKSGSLTMERSSGYLNLISDEMDRLDRMLDNYRGLTRPVKIEKEAVGINQLIEKTVALMRMTENAPKIELDLSPEVPFCNSDPQTLYQVFINLIRNSHEACGSEGDLHITTEHFHPWIRITFSDSGKGVPPEILPRIFEPFVSTKANGMGLGLAICRRLVDLNEGTIAAENHEGGARFIIHLPAGNELLPPA